MPLYVEKGEPIRLRNEVSLEPTSPYLGVENFLSNFNTHSKMSEIDDQTKRDLADFLNEEMMGPYLLNDDIFFNDKEALGIVIYHPDDREKFKARFDWEESPESVVHNAAALVERIKAGFQYDTPTMQDLAANLKQLFAESEREITLSEIEEVMKKVWSPSCESPDTESPSIQPRTLTS